MATHKEISELAYKIWEAEGRPDGNRIVHSVWGDIKLRDSHWLFAKYRLEEKMEKPKTISDLIQTIEKKGLWGEFEIEKDYIHWRYESTTASTDTLWTIYLQVSEEIKFLIDDNFIIFDVFQDNESVQLSIKKK